jgi:HAMP domain-containing protein
VPSAPLRYERVLFMATSALGLAVLAVWIGLFARSVTGRVSRLRDAATHIAEGEGEQPIEIAGTDELADLGAAFNAMQRKVRPASRRCARRTTSSSRVSTRARRSCTAPTRCSPTARSTTA